MHVILKRVYCIMVGMKAASSNGLIKRQAYLQMYGEGLWDGMEWPWWMHWIISRHHIRVEILLLVYLIVLQKLLLVYRIKRQAFGMMCRTSPPNPKTMLRLPLHLC